MNCRSCGASLPQGVTYCPVCQQPVLYARADYQGPSFPQAAQQPGSRMANPWQSTFESGQVAPHPCSPSFPPAPQAPDAPHPPQRDKAAVRPTTENLSFTPFGQTGNQFSPSTGNQQWPGQSNALPGQLFSHNASPYGSAPAIPPHTQPFSPPITQSPAWASNMASPAANAAGRSFIDQPPSAPGNLPQNQQMQSGIQSAPTMGQVPASGFPAHMSQPAHPDATASLLAHRPPTGPFPSPITSSASQERPSGLLSSQSPSGTFPRAKALPGTTEKTLGLLSSHSSGRFPASKAQPAPSENTSRFLYGPSPAHIAGSADPNTAAPFLPGQFPASGFSATPARPEITTGYPYGPSAHATASVGPIADMQEIPANSAPAATSTGSLDSSHKTQSGRLGSYGVISSMKKRRSPTTLIGLVCLIVVLVAGGAFAAVTVANKGFDLTATSSVMLPANAASINAATTGPSGQQVAASASSIIISAQTASTLNENYIPTHLTTSFTTNQTIYVSLVIDSNNQPGYVMVKWYADKQLLSSDNLAHNPKNTIAFFTRKYTSAATGNAELYWCTKADCSDAQLARVVNFTVGGASNNATSYSAQKRRQGQNSRFIMILL